MGTFEIFVDNMGVIKMKNRKGIIYSLLTLFLVGSSIFLVTIYFNTLEIEGQNFANKIRADDFNNFYNSLVRDLERSLKISTFRALLHATDITVTTGQPFQNSEARIAEMIFTGTLDGSDVVSLLGIGNAPCNTVTCWKDDYSALASTAGFELSIEIESVSVTPYDSWNLNSSASIDITLKDTAANMILKRKVIQSSKVSILGFEDPLYVFETQGKITKIIRKTSESPLITAGEGFGWAMGSVETNLNSGNKNKILSVSDASNAPSPQLETFGGAIFESDVGGTIQIPYLALASGTGSLTVGEKIFFENVTNSSWDVSNEIIGKAYHESYFGPSYLDRLEGRNIISETFKSQTPNPIGLMSFIDFVEFESKGVPADETKTCIDYLYFSGQSNSLC